MNFKTSSEDFHIGQKVVCRDPDVFLQPLRSYLKDRTGTVERVYPATRPDEYYCGQVNKVSVRWGKRNGRGKERVELMRPRDILPVE